MPLPTSPLIKRACIDAWISRLIDPVIGFNPQYEATKSAYEEFAKVDNIVIDTSPSSLNFLIGKVDDIAAIRGGSLTYPLFNVYADRTTPAPMRRDSEKGRIFAGDVFVSMDVHLSWSRAMVVDDFSIGADIIDATIMTVFNYVGYNNLWPSPLAWTQEMGLIDSTGITTGGEGWIERLTYRGRFRVIV